MLCISPPEHWFFVFLRLEKKNPPNTPCNSACHSRRIFYSMRRITGRLYSSDDQFLERDLFIIVRAR